MSNRIDNFVVREADGRQRFAHTLVLGAGLRVVDTAGGLPELTGLDGELYLSPSGGANDAPRIQAALDTPGVGRVRLAPGTFPLGAPLLVRAGQTLAGSGTGQTVLQASHPGTAVTLQGPHAAVADLHVSANGGAGVSGTGGDLRVEGVRVSAASVGVHLAGRRLSVHRCRIELCTGAGLSFDSGEHVSVTETAIQGSTPVGVTFNALDCIRMAGVTIRDCETGIELFQGSAHSFSAVRISTCDTAVAMNTTGSVSLAGVQAADCGMGFYFDNASQISLDACSALYGRGTGLFVSNCRSVAVNGFYADRTLGSGSSPHVVVGAGSTLVFFGSIQHGMSSVSVPIELDVSGAGGRVLFAQQNFTPAKINSGGNFVAL